jgi:glycosyltransferase involved in cell wall biosynthesis
VIDPWPVLVPPSGATVSPRRTVAFSVVIAAHQAERTVAAAVESALGQTEPPSEVVVCDDGSTDGTADVVRTFGAAVRLVSRANGGESAAKNSAVAAARGDFVAVLDADDVYAPRRLEALGWLARHRPDLDVLLTDARLCAAGTEIGTAYHRGWPFETARQPVEILRRNFVLGQAAVRRERWLAVGGFDEAVRLTADWDFFIRLLRSGSAAGLVDVPLAEYRLRAGTLSADRTALVESRIATLLRARSRERLDATELDVLDAALAGQRRELLVRRARHALRTGGRRARGPLLAIARDAGFRPTRRVAALAAAGVPQLAAAVLRGRESGSIEIGTGARVRAGA